MQWHSSLSINLRVHHRELSLKKFLEGGCTRSESRKEPLKPQMPPVPTEDCKLWAWVLSLFKNFITAVCQQDDCKDCHYHLKDTHTIGLSVYGDNSYPRKVCVGLGWSWRATNNKQSRNQCAVLTVLARLGSLQRAHLPKRFCRCTWLMVTSQLIKQ